MNGKGLLFIIFILLALVQLYVPANMIFDREEVLETGKEYKFKLAPFDPSDPFRGKYINLRYEDNIFELQDGEAWTVNENIYVHLMPDRDGFAKILAISKEEPKDRTDYIKAKVGYVTTHNGLEKITIDYPFDRYYMEESKAYEAELAYRESLRDTSQVTYALVNIKDGDAVLKDVLIDGTSIRKMVETEQEKKE